MRFVTAFAVTSILLGCASGTDVAGAPAIVGPPDRPASVTLRVVALDAHRSLGLDTTGVQRWASADSIGFWSVVSGLDTVFGRQLFRPADRGGFVPPHGIGVRRLCDDVQGEVMFTSGFCMRAFRSFLISVSKSAVAPSPTNRGRARRASVRVESWRGPRGVAVALRAHIPDLKH